jgi:hypothetical protein
MKNQENIKTVTVNGNTYDVTETTKNGIQTLLVTGYVKVNYEGKTYLSNKIGQEIQGKRGQTIDFKSELDNIIKNEFENPNSIINKYQIERIKAGLQFSNVI